MKTKMEECSEIFGKIRELDKHYKHDRKYLKKRLANSVQKARFNDDLSIVEIAKTLGITRQYLNSVLIEEYGIQHPDKAAAARAGHK